MRKDDATSLCRHQIAEKKIIRAVLAEYAEATHLLHACAAHRHGWAERELHALEHVSDEHTGGHLDRHAGAFQLRPQRGGAAVANGRRRAGNAAIRAGDQADFILCKRRYDSPQILRGDAHIAVTDDENRVLCRRRHAIKRGDLGVCERRLAADDKTRWDGRVPRRDLARDLETGVVQRARTEEDFVGGIVLLKKPFKMLGEIGLSSVQRFEQTDWGSERRLGGNPLPAKVKGSCYHHEAVNGGGDQSKDAQREQEMKHRDNTVHLIAENSC